MGNCLVHLEVTTIRPIETFSICSQTYCSRIKDLLFLIEMHDSFTFILNHVCVKTYFQTRLNKTNGPLVTATWLTTWWCWSAGPWNTEKWQSCSPGATHSELWTNWQLWASPAPRLSSVQPSWWTHHSVTCFFFSHDSFLYYFQSLSPSRSWDTEEQERKWHFRGITQIIQSISLWGRF